MSTDSNINVLVGLTLVEATQEGDDRLVLKTQDRSFLFYHSQDCCESVSIENIKGDLNHLVDSPILDAREVIAHENPPGWSRDYQDSFTWTTYTLTTAKGSVEIRWYGESNGYYSESVSFVETTKGQPEW